MKCKEREYFEILKLGKMSGPNKKEIASILESVASFIRNMGNDCVRIELAVGISRDC
jgi:hypothetical protein